MKMTIAAVLAVVTLAAPAAALADSPPGGTTTTAVTTVPMLVIPTLVITASCNTNADGSATWAMVSITTSPMATGYTSISASYTVDAAQPAIADGVPVQVQSPLGGNLAIPGQDQHWLFPFGQKISGSIDVTITGTFYDPLSNPYGSISATPVVPIYCTKLSVETTGTIPITPLPVTTPLPTIPTLPVSTTTTDTTSTVPVLPTLAPEPVVTPPVLVGPTGRVRVKQNVTFTAVVFPASTSYRVLLAKNSLLKFVSSKLESLPGPAWVIAAIGGNPNARQKFTFVLNAVQPGRACASIVVTKGDVSSQRVCFNVAR